ncbi:uncharacterized protein LOC103843722 [Brassica rapa]|uniref:Uncharacterized protein n=2 Tax=Brassica TaxID=3705 RepID=A0ABQ8CAU2_BRANA|nr:uncharacterized protein LOC103843722 [Brassica rapa]XP_009118736.2 uncharacterized protein LOC103843722 [Brassica rapa]XP_048597956.1 uncharacterized protein LOC125578655 [Brassica napus]XP_048597957.1 uncharacterized protein LOC125578655 [Brassica napus]KAH0913673.1 hypothetical protein HID58_036994 [Brassica napus]CAG7867647.1 unnamed protein product [Brassica rapa]VDC64569.1 unnamed protein product [Brassica rapa]
MATSHESVKCICSDKKVVEVDPKTWKSKCGTFQCLKDILDVLKSDMFFEGVDVSFSSMKLIAKNVSTRSQTLQLVCVVADRLKFLLDPKRRSLVEKMIEEIADGFEVNKCFDPDEIFEFIYELLDNGLNNRSVFPEDNATIISELALKVLHKRMEKREVNQELIDPFLPLVMGCLSNQTLLPSALRGLKSLLKFPLPSLREEGDSLDSLGDRLVGELSYIAAGGMMNISLDCSLSCFAILKWYISKEITMQQMSILIKFDRLFEDIETDVHCRALSLIEAIIERRFEFEELSNIVSVVSYSLIHSVVEKISLKCQQILLEYLANYTLSDKILDGHIDIMLQYTRCNDQKKARALTMVRSFISKFSEPGLGSKSKRKYLNKLSSRFFATLLPLIPRDADPFKAPSPVGELIGLLTEKTDVGMVGNLIPECLSAFKEYPAAVAEVLFFFMKALEKRFRKHIITILKKVEVAHTSDESHYSLFMVFSTFRHFPGYQVLDPEFEEMWRIVFKSLLHTESRLRNICCKLLKEYFNALGKKNMASSQSLVATLFMVAAHLCFVLKENTSSDHKRDLTENLVHVLSALHSWIGQLDQATCNEFWFSLGENEKEMFREAFKVIDREEEGVSRDLLSENGNGIRKGLIGILLKRMGELALEKESVQMSVVFSVYEELSQEKEWHLYASEVMYPLCKVCEGFAGENISVELKKQGENVRDSLRSANNIFGEAYVGIRQGLQANRKKRAGEELAKAGPRKKIE